MSKINHSKYMALANKEARKNFKKLHGGPFGACIVKKGKILAINRNTVLKNDATSHAEISAIRAASKKLKTFDLSGCALYSTTEPCPMCFSAIHWARIDKIYYGTSIADVKLRGFNELSISNSKMKILGKSKVRIKSAVDRESCVKLLEDWDRLKKKVFY